MINTINLFNRLTNLKITFFLEFVSNLFNEYNVRVYVYKHNYVFPKWAKSQWCKCINFRDSSVISTQNVPRKNNSTFRRSLFDFRNVNV